MTEMIEKDAKIVVLGSVSVGKTSLIERYVRGSFSETTTATIGGASLSKIVTHDDKSLRLQIWDTAGAEKYHSLASLYYRDADVALLVFDLCNHASFETMKEWLDEVRVHAPSEVTVVIVGNKADKVKEQQVPTDEVMSYAKTMNALVFLTSAKEDKGIEEMFANIVEILVEVKRMHTVLSGYRSSRITLSANPINKTKLIEDEIEEGQKKGCCGN